MHRIRMETTLHVQEYKYQKETGHGPSGVSTRKETEIRRYQRTQRWVSVVRGEDREHMVQDKRACGSKYERGIEGSRVRMEMKGRVQVVHEGQDRDLENRD